MEKIFTDPDDADKDEPGTPSTDTKPTPTYIVTFETNGGDDVSSQMVNSGGKVTIPTTPTKTGYTFVGWYKDSGYNTPWDFITIQL